MPQKILKKIHHYVIPHEGNGYKPHVVRHKNLIAYSALLILVKLLIVGTLFLSYPGKAEFSTITTNRIVELTNRARTEEGLSELRINETLNRAAMLKAQHMISNNYFAHDAPDGSKPWKWFKQVGYEYTYAGENLAMNFSEAEDAVEAWMESPSHRENMLSPNYQDIGVAVVIGELEGSQTTLVVQLFGKSYLETQNGFAVGSAAVTNAKAGATDVVVAAERVEVKLENKESSWRSQLVFYGKRFMLIMMIFVIVNLLLTIVIRIRIQHKPVILHCLLVIGLALGMLLWNAHFVEGVGRVIQLF